MATENPQLMTCIAGADLSADANKYKFVKFDATGDSEVIVCTAVTDRPCGVLYSLGEAGAEVLVAYAGLTKVQADEALTAGDAVGTQTDGQAQVCVVGTETTVYDMGTVVRGVSNAGELATVLLKQGARAA